MHQAPRTGRPRHVLNPVYRWLFNECEENIYCEYRHNRATETRLSTEVITRMPGPGAYDFSGWTLVFEDMQSCVQAPLPAILPDDAFSANWVCVGIGNDGEYEPIVEQCLAHDTAFSCPDA